MALSEQPDESAGVPEWVVTFGDMMSLLLTFFIMLVSLSEIKEQEQYQAMVNSIRKRFGHDMSDVSLVPGNSKPRNSTFDNLASMGRSQRFDTHQGGDKVKAPVGDFPRVRIVRPGSRTTVGAVIHFDEGSTRIPDSQKELLASQAQDMLGKPQKIEIRGHTSLRPPPKDSPFQDHFDLAYQRCRVTMQFLVQQGIDPHRIRLSVAGPNEPLHLSTRPDMLRLNPRVEVHVLDETVKDFQGSEPATRVDDQNPMQP